PFNSKYLFNKRKSSREGLSSNWKMEKNQRQES
ncbi:uncharacterized protein METZ01_LOCUS485664, partial [marine metagenome]